MSQLPELAWIAEARKHIGLKEIKGSKHNPIILSWLKKLKAWWADDEQAWCLTGDIEVLTDQGFIRLDEVNNLKPHKVAQLNPVTLGVEFTSSYAYVEKIYTGQVLDINAGNLSFTCDPKHKLFGAFSGTRKYKLREADTLTKFGIEIPNIKSSQTGVACTDNDLVFLAAFLSDGCVRFNRVNFKFSKQHKIKIIETFPYLRKTVDTKLYGISTLPYVQYSFDKALLKSEYLTEYKLMSWDFITALSQAQCKVFIDAYSNFDGTKDKNNSYEVFTSDKRLQEQLNYIATMAGYKSTPFSTKQLSLLSKKEYLHHVYVGTAAHRCFNKSHVTSRHFEGKLYCLTVPSSIMIIRCRNGVILPIGNCGVFIAYCLQEANVPIPKHWYRALDYLSYGTRLVKPAYGCVAVKTRQGGGHVCFVVGKTSEGKLVCLGGNQNNMVCFSVYREADFEAFIWYGLTASPAQHRYKLPVLLGISPTETTEA